MKTGRMHFDRLRVSSTRPPGLGIELEDEFDAVFATILQFPQAAPPWRNRADRRVAVLDRFPFTLP